jgi:hypothetical protein
MLEFDSNNKIYYVCQNKACKYLNWYTFYADMKYRPEEDRCHKCNEPLKIQQDG